MFLLITVLLTVQVISRYVFGNSIAWAEELATMMFVLMIYCAISAAVTYRKHIKIDALQDAVPFKARKALMILSNVIFFAFCIWVQPAMYGVIGNLGNSVSPLLRIPKSYTFIMIPIFLALTAIRLIQDTIRLIGENEQNLGETIPTVDLDACEQEWQETKARMGTEREGK